MTRTEKTSRKLGPNRSDPARKSRRARTPSESCDLHEDRSTLQSKFAHIEATTSRVRTRSHVSVDRPYISARIDSSAVTAKLLPEHTSGPELRVAHLRLFKDGAQRVCVAGTFNAWKPEQTPLHQNGVGEWEVMLSLVPGDYEYRFVVDGQWMDDPLACRHAPNPYGGQNAVLHVHRS